MGADGVEADFRFTSDGEVVCIHDSTTTRTSNISHSIKSSTFAQLNAGNYGDGVGLPTLNDVLDCIPRTKILYLEIKDNSKACIDAIKVIIDAHDIESNQIKLISFAEGTSTTGLEYCKIIMPYINTLWLVNISLGANTTTTFINDKITLMKSKRIDGILPSKSLYLTHYNIAYINAIKNAGLYLGCWTSNNYNDSIILQDVGFESIITDSPNLHPDFRDFGGKCYTYATLSNLGRTNGDTTVCKDFPTGKSSHLYFYENEWCKGDGVVVKSFNSFVDGSVILTFDIVGLAGDNLDIPTNYGSAKSTTSQGWVVGGSGCPNINVLWALKGNYAPTDVWEKHSGVHFTTAFGSDKPVAQMDCNSWAGHGSQKPPHPTIKLTTTLSTAQIKIVGFKIGNAMDRSSTLTVGDNKLAWIINIYEDNATSGNKLYTQTTNSIGAGESQVISINYVGAPNQNLMIEFDDQGDNLYYTAIDSLEFHQVYGEAASGDLVP